MKSVFAPWIKLVFAIVLAISLRASASVSFSRDVRPILAANCLKCHGIDEGSRKSRLRLDDRATAIGAAKSGKSAIVPSKPDASELVRRIESTDPTEVMPPSSTHVVLGAAQKATLRAWIAEGAPYEKHWAFSPPLRQEIPTPNLAVDNPIDAFVEARLESLGLHLSDEADRYALIRRVYLDLIGLPPTPAEADAFANDHSPDAYETIVDHLLASPAYGERWARRWLDLARYADTNGFEKDRPRVIWPYRDWVINALNADMPFDEFTIEQIAGDMLPHATTAQKIATGFHRNTMLNEEGGVDPLEYRFYASIDRNNTTGAAWLGLTVGCAQCHTHKYDPITHDEYYKLLAFLNNADEPQLELSDAKIDQQRKANDAAVAKLWAKLPEKFPGDGTALANAFDTWENAATAAAVHWTVMKPTALRSTLPYLTPQEDGSILAGGDIEKSTAYDLTFAGSKNITAIRLEAIPDDTLPGHGPGLTFYEGELGDFFLSTISVNADDQPAVLKGASQTAGSPASEAIDADPQTGWAITGHTGKRQVAVFAFDKPVSADHALNIHLLFERYFAAPLGRFRISVTSDPQAAKPRAFDTDLESILTIDPAKRTDEQRQALFNAFLAESPKLAASRKEIDALRAKQPAPLTTLVMRQRPADHERPTFVHHRGEYLSTVNRVEPGIPAFLSASCTELPRDRLSFARWLVSRGNPLTARVQVNRQWQAFFGRGIVRTLQDFGYQGELPSNQPLLDYLAVRFMDDGWSMKKLDKLIVLSRTYRQSSRVTPELVSRDPENILLARGPRFRAEAEIIRDEVLKGAGLLSTRIGGPSVFPPQPASVTTEGAYGALTWRTSRGEDRFRRSLYTYAKRTAPFAMYNTFDGPTGESCIVRREVSDTPLQALTLLNDTMFIEAAQAMGRRVCAEQTSDSDRVAMIFRNLLVRPPDAAEVRMLIDFAHARRDALAQQPIEAHKIAGPDVKDNVTECAAWTLTARAVMNLDELATKE